MAYENADADDTKPTMEVPAGLAEALPELIDSAIGHMNTAFLQKQEEMTDYYKGELPGVTQEDMDDGRSDIVSRDVHDAVMATMPDLVRCFLGADHVVEFEPAGPDDDEQAAQMTDAIRQIFEKENDAFSIIYGALKDGLIRKYSVACWWHETEDRSFVKEYTLGEMELAAFIEAQNGEAEVLSEEVVQQGEEKIVKAKVRHVRHVQCYRVELVPPEELIVSRRARGIKGDHLVGRRQNLTEAELREMGISQELIDENKTSDSTIEDNELARQRNPAGDTGQEDGEEDTILYVESYLRWAHEDGVQLFKVCTLGDGHTIVACEPVDAVDMALWTPDPEPHTPIGESQAEKVHDIQRLKTGVLRGIIDSLAEALVPRTEVVEGQVNIEDAMSTEIGGLVRVRQPNTVRPLSTPFVGQQALPLIETIDNMREERVGAFRAADGLSAEAMQSSTKMAVAATISGSKAQKELLARTFAAMFLVPIFRGLLRMFVQHQDKPKMMRLRGKWVPVDPSSWNADMDCTVDVALALTTVEEKAQHLGGIAEKQEQILQTMGLDNPLVSLQQYANTLRELVRLTGRKNIDSYFNAIPAEWKPPQQQPQPDPAAILAGAQAQALELEANRKDAEALAKKEREDHQQQLDEDFRRDQLDQQRSLELLKIAAQYGVKTEQTDKQIMADLFKHRDAMQQQTFTGAIDRDTQQQQHQATLDHQARESDKQRTHEGGLHAVDMAAAADRQQADLSAADARHQREIDNKPAPKKE